MARVRAKPTRPPKYEMADMSPGKAEERIRNHPVPARDNAKILQGAGTAFVGFFQDAFTHNTLAMFLLPSKPSTK